MKNDFTNAIDIIVPWSVCLSRSCIVLKRQKTSIRTISFAHEYDSPMFLPDCGKILLRPIDQPIPIPYTKFCPKVTHPLLMCLSESGTFDGKLRLNGYGDSAMVTMDSLAYRKPSSLFRTVQFVQFNICIFSASAICRYL